MENLKKAVGDAGMFISRAVQDAHITDEASTMLNRAKQFTEEKLGKAERTENDPNFEILARRTDKIKSYTEKLVKDGEAVLVPNPAARLETFMFENIPVDKIGVTNKRQTNLEYLGQDMIEAGNEFGAGTPYGSALIRVGQTEQALGDIEHEYIRAGHESMMGPLQRFLDGEMRNITRERKILENKRLDLDACKNKVRKARGMQLQPTAETELRVAQAEYDKQMEITKLLMEGLNAIQTNHLRHIKSFVEVQAKYYANCHQIMQDLQKELANTTTMAMGETSTPVLRTTIGNNNDSIPGPGQSYYPAPGAFGAYQNGGQDPNQEMQQINLASPPPQTIPANFRNAEFF